MKTLLTTVFLVVISFGFVFAQTPKVNPYLITTGERIFEYEQISGDSSRTFGTIYERITHNQEENLIEIVFVQELPNATLIDTLIVDSETFGPVRYRSLVPKFQDISVRYSIPGSAEIDMLRNIPNQKVDTTYSVKIQSTVYDYHWPHVLLYAVGSLEKDGDVINLPVFTYRNKKSRQPISYVGNESVLLHDEEHNAVIWKAVDPQSGTKNT